MSKVYESPEVIVTNFLQHYDIQFEEQMEEINLRYKMITELPLEFGNAFTTGSLTSLDISSNKIENFPEGICALRSLKILKCSSNKFVKLPEEIGALSKLKELNCYNNKIEELPDSICSLKFLEMINFNNNELTKLPEEIGALSKLKELNCYNNKIEVNLLSYQKK
eukprot:TRINITY_DN1026_c0_g3_i2.p1 TRINITY_DN1026_c0_g3~~TRINITY_DN1026_c0_g3_i2.p1  ORF type:complete len:166 (-),score=30.85 TRINITY_DN1026_c0_g3_i2:36-533(-)